MRKAMFLIVSALGLACAHQPAPPAAEAPSNEPQAHAGLSDGSGDPRLGELAPTSQHTAGRAEAADEASDPSQSDLPKSIQPEAPTTAVAPPGSALAPAAPEAASKNEADLRERIQRTLLHDNSLSFTAKRVRVEVDRGQVTLLGEVRTAREKTEVEDLVQKVSGVRRVQNRLAVIDQAQSATPDGASR